MLHRGRASFTIILSFTTRKSKYVFTPLTPTNHTLPYTLSLIVASATVHARTRWKAGLIFNTTVSQYYVVDSSTSQATGTRESSIARSHTIHTQIKMNDLRTWINIYQWQVSFSHTRVNQSYNVPRVHYYIIASRWYYTSHQPKEFV